MTDTRVKNLAKILCKYCMKAQPEENIGIHSTTEAEPLVVEFYEELIKAGANPVVRIAPARTSEIFYRYGKDHHFDKVTPLQRAFARHLDGSVHIQASPNTRSLSKVDPKKQARVSKASKPLRAIMIKKKWCITLFPTQAHAQDADMSLSDFEDFIYSATFADRDRPIQAWKSLAQKQDKLIGRLKGAKDVRIVGPETDLKMSIKDRTFINSPGTHNMPSGEVFTGPVEDSAEGYIRYDFPVCHAGREIDGIRLVFRKGKVVEATADKNAKFLQSMLEMDPGAKRLGELGIGTNYGIQKFIKNILFDEKIGGTIHLALGQSYEETGGVNKSALHWDMIKDLRKGGALYVNGKVFQKDGKFVGGF
ncbi:MAG: aminopeptidase [Verrucomicrobia bacterium]|nr:aminopeptidase [Verrucomicrobiota bacterium]